MIRVWLRHWLGISQIDARVALFDERIRNVEQQPTFADISRKQFEIENALREAKEIREGAVKRAPVVARSMRQFKALMEQD